MKDLEQRTLDLANRLHDMTYAEWKRVRYLIDKKFERKMGESEWQLQLAQVSKDDLNLF